MPSYFVFTLSVILGFVLSYFISHPNSRLNKKLPEIKIRSIQFIPCIKVKIRGKIIHVHHWLFLSVLFVVSITFGGGILDTIFSKGFILGGIVQGLRFPDWKKIYD